MSSVLHHIEKSGCLLICPQFSYRKGGLNGLEADATTRLRSKGLLLDRKFTLLFNKASRSDARDSRPLNYDGRLVITSNQSNKEVFFASSALWVNGYTDFASQLPSKEMVVVEDIGDSAVPSTCDGNNAVVQAALFPPFHLQTHSRVN